MSNRLYYYALSFLGVPYKFGGRNRLEGLDCSQLCIEILISAGLLPHGFDTTAQGLYDYFVKDGKIKDADFGCLCFFGEHLKAITHVGFCLDRYCMIEAGGGHSDTVTLQKAIDSSAMVRIRPVRYRKDYLCSVMPRYQNV